MSATVTVLDPKKMPGPPGSSNVLAAPIDFDGAIGFVAQQIRQASVATIGAFQATGWAASAAPLFHYFAILRVDGCRAGRLGDITINKRLALLQVHAPASGHRGVDPRDRITLIHQRLHIHILRGYGRWHSGQKQDS